MCHLKIGHEYNPYPYTNINVSYLRVTFQNHINVRDRDLNFVTEISQGIGILDNQLSLRFKSNIHKHGWAPSLGFSSSILFPFIGKNLTLACS